MGNCCGKENLKSSPSNSFTSLKFTTAKERKPSTKSNSSKVRRKSGGSNKEPRNSIEPTKQKQPPAPYTNGRAYTEKARPTNNQPTSGGRPTNNQHQSGAKHPNNQQPSGKLSNSNSSNGVTADGDGRTPSYKLRQADLVREGSPGTPESGRKLSSIERRCLEVNKSPVLDRAGGLRLEQQLLTGHRRTGSGASSLSGSQSARDRSDSQRRAVPADFIRKGSWTHNESRIRRNDSDNKITQPSPLLTRSSKVPPVNAQPSILVDHCVTEESRSNKISSSSIPAPTSPSLTRSDSCKNDENPVLRNKGHLQQRRQVVSAMTIDTGLTDISNENNLHPGDYTGRGVPVRANSKLPPNAHQQCASVLKWKKGNLLGRGTFGQVCPNFTLSYCIIELI